MRFIYIDETQFKILLFAQICQTKFLPNGILILRVITEMYFEYFYYRITIFGVLCDK